jgi:hypothetical protein
MEKPFAPGEKIQEDKAKENVKKWKEEMRAWIKTLPIEQQAEQLAKHKLLNGKRKREATTLKDVKDKTIQNK